MLAQEYLPRNLAKKPDVIYTTVLYPPPSPNPATNHDVQPRRRTYPQIQAEGGSPKLSSVTLAIAHL